MTVNKLTCADYEEFIDLINLVFCQNLKKVNFEQDMPYIFQNDEEHMSRQYGLRNDNGKLVAADSVKSRELLNRAAELKEPNALYEYAELLIADGKDVYSYMKEAADLGNEKAMIYMFDRLDGQKRYNEAYKYAQKLYLAGNHEGTRRLADYYLEGKCVSRDKSIAKDLYYEASRAGNKEAKKKLRGL